MTFSSEGRAATDHTATEPSVRNKKYLQGFGNELQSEAVAGALPLGQNSPQNVPFGLVSELVSGTTFSAPRALNRRTYMFRIRPSTAQGRYHRLDSGLFWTPPLSVPPDPNDYAWTQFQVFTARVDFIDGIRTLCGNGTPLMQTGMAIHVYCATASMVDRVFMNADGEFLIVPQLGALRIPTELGVIVVSPGEFALIPRGIKFRVEIPDGRARGYICENYGPGFRLPELGVIGSNGLANASDFQIPVAAYEDRETPTQLVRKFGGNLWVAELSHSPLNVVAWRGSLTPCKYDMNRFVALGTATIDHPDPSIYCALTSPSDSVMGPNVELMVLPPRWTVAERTLRVPGFHQNCVTEFAAFLPAPDSPTVIGSLLHNNWVPHGPSTDQFEQGRVASLQPERIGGAASVMFESRFPVGLTEYAVATEESRPDYVDRWGGFKRRFLSQ
jgi:homogentisate 1,2-dioxygenase